MYTKILCVSDVVVSLLQSPELPRRLQDVDLILGCGDLPLEYLEYLASRFSRPLLFVQGNHPTCVMDAETCVLRTQPEGCVDIDGRVVEFRGLLIAGLEGSLHYNDGPQQYTQRQMALKIARMSPRLMWNRWLRGRAADIIITHAPPRGIHDAPDLPHRGFDAFLPLMRRYRPRYLIHGHTHLYRQDAQRLTQFGPTSILNAYGYQVIEVADYWRLRSASGRSGARRRRSSSPGP
jgi:Icc-related predicted phosphoesterase